MASVINSTNFFEGNNPKDLIEKFGSPLFVYNERILRRQMKNVQTAIRRHPNKVNFSIKANSNLEILKIARDSGLYADAMSENELRLLLMAGYEPNEVLFVPNNVAISELKFAIDNGILIAADCLEQLEVIGSINRGGNVALRINPGVGAGHHEKVVTAGKNTKFAIAANDIDRAIEIAKEYDMRIVGISQHVGSLFMEPELFLQAVNNLLVFATKFEKLDFIDFGGGYGIPYQKLSGQAEFDMDALASKFDDILDEFVEKVGYQPLFKTEPGRYNVAEGGVLLGTVYATKQNAGRQYAGTDIGMNVLARPTLYDSWHDVEIIRDGVVVDPDDLNKNDLEEVTVTGNICESGDILAKNRLLPRIKSGDLVCVLDSGAYGYVMSSNYNTRPRACEVLIEEGGNVRIIRRRETFEDLISLYP